MTTDTQRPTLDKQESISHISEIFWELAEADSDLEKVLPGDWHDLDLTVSDRQRQILENARTQLGKIIASIDAEWPFL